MRVYNYKISNPKIRKSKFAFFKPILKRLTKKHWNDYATWTIRLFAAGALLIAFLFVYYSFSLPNPNRLLGREVPESTKIYARDGSLLYEIHDEYKRTLVGLDQISPDLQQATVAIEDKNFYKHHGFSITGYIRSAVKDIIRRDIGQGGSTITQQFVKNAVLSKEKHLTRKLKELILSIEIEARFSKDDILKLYLNEIPYGRNAYGVEAAAQTYFGKNAKDVTLAESAYLAALPQSPTRYNPFGPNRDLLDGRKNYILKQMLEQGYIPEDRYQKALAEKVEFKEIKTSLKAPHFSLYVQNYLASKYGEKTLQEGGLKVFTTLDPRLQEIAEKAVSEGVEKNSKKYQAANSALTAIDPKTGQILAMVGSKDYFGKPEPAGCTPGKNCSFEPNVNVVLSQRQPGSSFKPYAYLTAFKKEFGYSPASLLFDVVTNFGKFGNKDYVPHNYDNGERGPVSIRKAFAGSLNIPAVKILSLVGVENVTKTAHEVGITSPLQNCGLSLVLGGCEVTLLDHVSGYATIANEGVKHDKTSILKILDRNGEILEEYKENAQIVVDPQAVYELIDIMTDNNARSYVFGANSPLNFGDRPVGCKTGTTQNWHDGWTLCFTPSLAVGVWSGNNDGKFLARGADGVFVAAPIVHKFLTEALNDQPVEKFKEPDGIKRINVDSVSGKLPTEYSPQIKTEIFADYSAPKDMDNVHIGIKIDSATGQPANQLTPPERIIIKPYTVFHSERKENPSWENPVIAWALANGYTYPLDSGTLLPPKNDAEISLDIVEPIDGSEITQLPFSVSVAAAAKSGISRIDLVIDGELVQSLKSPPFIFSVNRKYTDGVHIIAVHAVDLNGQTADISTTVNFALEQPARLLITSPSNNETIAFPVDLVATSRNNLAQVNFYLEGNSGTRLIGKARVATNPNGDITYSFLWQEKPAGGQYKIFARSTTGTVSTKISVIVP